MAADIGCENNSSRGHRFQWLERCNQLCQAFAPARKHEDIDEIVVAIYIRMFYATCENNIRLKFGHQQLAFRSSGS